MKISYVDKASVWENSCLMKRSWFLCVAVCYLYDHRSQQTRKLRTLKTRLKKLGGQIVLNFNANGVVLFFCHSRNIIVTTLL